MAMLLYAPVAFILVYFQQYVAAVAAGAIIVGTTRVPDWDLWLPGVSHRGITHTLLFVVFFGLLIGMVFAVGIFYGPKVLPLFSLFYDGAVTTRVILIAGGFGFFCGATAIFAHLMADIITPMGLQPLVPFSTQRYGLRVARAANPIANGVLLTAGSVAVVLGWTAGVYFSGVLPNTVRVTFDLPLHALILLL